jgi:hypothetical protein
LFGNNYLQLQPNKKELSYAFIKLDILLNSGKSIKHLMVMRKFIFLFFIYIFASARDYAQFSEEQMDIMTAHGISSAIEPNGEAVLNKARAISDKYPGDYSMNQICAAFDYINSGWSYQNDPGGLEYFEKGSDAITTLTGDCDDYAIAMSSLIQALGGDARIIRVSGHAYPELYLGQGLTQSDMDEILKSINDYYKAANPYRRTIKRLNYHHDNDDSVWLNLDYQDSYPGGSFVEYSPAAKHFVIYSSGKYRYGYLNEEKLNFN